MANEKNEHKPHPHDEHSEAKHDTGAKHEPSSNHDGAKAFHRAAADVKVDDEEIKVTVDEAGDVTHKKNEGAHHESSTGAQDDKESHEGKGSKEANENKASAESSGATAKNGEPAADAVLDEVDAVRKKHDDEREQRERKLQQSLLEAELKILRLENEMRQLNDQYTKKVTEKAAEAQKLVNKRLSELQDDFSAQTAEAKKYALKRGGAKLAEVLQQFDMVLSTSQKASDAVKGYAQGFAMVFDMMVKALAELGITEITIKPGDAFDHATMEIFEGVDSKDHKHNQVVEVLKKGYRLHDLVIAHAIVKVAN